MGWGPIRGTLAALILGTAAAVGCPSCSTPPFAETKTLGRRTLEQRLEQKVDSDEFDEFKERRIVDSLQRFVYSFYDLAIGPEALPRPEKQDCITLRFENDFLVVDRRETESISLPKFSPEETLRLLYSGARLELKGTLSTFGFGESCIEELEKGNIPGELEEFFEKRGLAFRRFDVGAGLNPIINCDLRRILGETELKLEIWGVSRTFRKRSMAEPVIEPFFSYFRKKLGDGTTGIGGAALRHEGLIECYSNFAIAKARDYYSKISVLRGELEKEIANPELLDRFYSAAENRIQPEFFLELSRILRYSSLKGAFESSKSEEDFAKQTVPVFEHDAELEEAKHLIDFENVDPARHGQRFEMLFEGYTELGAALTRIRYGSGMNALGECFALVYAGFKHPELADAHAAAAKLLTQLFIFELEANKQSYASVDYSGYDAAMTPEQCCFELLKQFVRLSDSQVRQIAEKVYQGYFKGQKLEDFVKEQMRKN